MITIQINEKPLIDLKNSAMEIGKQVSGQLEIYKEKAETVVRQVQGKVNLNPSKVSYYSSIAANLASFKYGYATDLNIIFTAIQYFSLCSVWQKMKLGKEVSDEERSYNRLSGANLFLNVITSALNMPYIKLAGTIYNAFSGNIQVSVKD